MWERIGIPIREDYQKGLSPGYFNLIQMTIDISKIKKESFNIKEGEINGNKVFLITPQDFNCEWDKDNLHLRSLIIDEYGNICSHGLKKFMNFGEKPELYPNPKDYSDWVLEQKADGSLAVVDFIFDKLNIRTRGVISAIQHLNYSDFEYILNKYPNIEVIARANPDDSLLFEITSPNAKIILDYGNEPDIFFLGFIHKPTGLYYPAYSKEGEFIKSQIGCKSPEIYKIQGSLLEIAEEIKKWEGREGVVLKYADNQHFIKIKSLSYLKLHRFKANATLKNVSEMFFEYNCPDYLTFRNKLIKTFDEDCFEMVDEYCKNVCDSYLHVLREIYELRQIVMDNANLIQKDYANFVLTNHKEQSSILFELRVKNEPSQKSIRKMLEKELNI